MPGFPTPSRPPVRRAASRAPNSAPALTALLATALVAGCVPGPKAPAPAPAPAPRAVPAPPRPAPVPPPVADWSLRPLTPGDWRYLGNGQAVYLDGATTRLALRCDAGARTIAMTRPDAPGAALTVRTSFGAQGVMGALPAAAPLWDQMVFSRGRVMVEAAGQPALIIPTWAEIGRVVEDCRR